MKFWSATIFFIPFTKGMQI